MKELILDENILDNINTKVIIHEEIPIAIIKYEGIIYAIDNRCPHRGGSLYKGKLKDGFISCPLHNWEFNLNSGSCSLNNKIKIKKFKVEYNNKKIIIKND